MSKSLSYPRSIRQVVAYLADRPNVLSTCNDSRVGTRILTFQRYANGGFWWLDKEGKGSYLPIHCGHNKMHSETGITFDASGFTVTKFKLAIRYEYISESPYDDDAEDARDELSN